MVSGITADRMNLRYDLNAYLMNKTGRIPGNYGSLERAGKRCDIFVNLVNRIERTREDFFTEIPTEFIWSSFFQLFETARLEIKFMMDCWIPMICWRMLFHSSRSLGK